LQALFATTLFLSATLLFLIQPMIAKMILPLLGGAPTVWISCMIFFQTILLAGYFYAHAVTASMTGRAQRLLQIGLLLVPLPALALLTLPLALARGQAATGDGPSAWLGPPPIEANPIPWLLGLLLVCVGLPFFVVATTAPLLQKWFANTKHPAAQDPYFLYGASNLGSILALLSYPALLEPYLGLKAQGGLWAAGYILLIALIAGCALVAGRSVAAASVAHAPAEPAPDPKPATQDLGRPTWGRRLRWVVLAFVPSSLLLGVTTFISNDIAAIPLLWIIPLVLYLLTFILVFARSPLVPHRLMVFVLPVLILMQLFWVLTGLTEPVWVVILIHLLTFFAAAMVCHGELVRDRPPAGHLTEFYVWMSVGGVLGGLFNVVLAPLLFSMVVEYPLETALACLLGPRPAPERRKPEMGWLNFGLPIIGAVLATAAMVVFRGSSPHPSGFTLVLMLGVPLVCYLLVSRWTDRPLLFGFGVGAILLVSSIGIGVQGTVLLRERSFYGIHRVVLEKLTDSYGRPMGTYIKLYHGHTLHGMQKLDKEKDPEPLTYYHRTGPIGQVFAAFDGPNSKPHVAVVGLGAGSIASYGRPGQEMTFYEIDPVVQRIAEDKQYFTFLHAARARGASVSVVLGDARLSLLRAPEQHYGLIVLDAFSSDAIPTHLLTREALQEVYLPKLADDGLLAFHISNKFLDLGPVVAVLAADAGLVGLIQADPGNMDIGKADSTWVVLARKEAHHGRLAGDARWERLRSRPGAPLWTDDFSNVLRTFRW
jgi:spermidine synthase